MAKDIRSIDVRDGAATHETSNPKAREHWSSREEKMLERRIYANAQYRGPLTEKSALTKPLIPGDKKLWQRLADEHNEEMTAAGMKLAKPRKSKSVRDKWRYKLSPFVRESWEEADWKTMTELLPTHFWQAVSSKTKYDHWQATFNTWVCLKGSAPSIQTMKNKIDKISKIVRSTNPGATFDMQPWFGLVDIARYLVNHKLEASASQREEESMITTNHHHFLDNQSRHKNPIRLQASASSSKMTCHSIVQLVDMSFPGSAYQSQCHHRGQSPIDGEDEENMNEAVEIAPTYYLDSSATSCQLVGSDSRMPQAYNQQEVALLQDKSLIISEPSDFTIFDNSTIEWEETTQLPALTEIEIESLGVYTLGSDK